MSLLTTRSILPLLSVSVCLLPVACARVDQTVELGVYNPPTLVVVDSGVAFGAPPLEPPQTQPPQLPPQPPPPLCADSGCISTTPFPDSDPNRECYQLIAHGLPTQPYLVGALSEESVSFTMSPLRPGPQYIRSIAPIVDNRKVLHHMRLYQQKTSPADGASSLERKDERLLLAWAPGSSGMFLDPALGIGVDSGKVFVLTIHYFNGVDDDAFSPARDASGFEICTTTTEPTYPVSWSRLGPERVAGTFAAGRCASPHIWPITLLALLPELDSAGTQAALAIQSGQRGRVLYDSPFDFEQVTLQPLIGQQLAIGETLTSSCYYLDQPVADLDARRCALYVLHWPAGTLVSTGENERCL